MKAVLIRTGSAPLRPAHIKIYISDQDSGNGIFFPATNTAGFTKSSLQFGSKSNQKRSPNTFRRTVSDTDLMLSQIANSTKTEISIGSRPSLKKKKGLDEEVVEECFGLKRRAWTEVLPGSSPAAEEVEYSGGGMGRGRRVGGGYGGGGGDENKEENGIEDYYKQMLLANPENSLLLMNYGKFLHEVEKDYERAEECYGRAILADPGDGEVLSLYGKLIWDAKKDQERAQSYFDQALQASPDDCYILGSYAHFLWDVDEDDEEVGGHVLDGTINIGTETLPMVDAC